MAESRSDSIRANVIGTVIGTVVIAIGGYLWASVFPGAWKWFTEVLAAVWEHLTSSAAVPTWWLYVLYAVGLAALLFIAALVREALTDKGPTFTDYREDRFFGAVWRWRYAQGGPTGAMAYCPSCDTVLVHAIGYDYGGMPKTTLQCETCQRDIATERGDNYDLADKVYRQIDRKVRNGEWKDRVKLKPLS